MVTGQLLGWVSSDALIILAKGTEPVGRKVFEAVGHRGLLAANLHPSFDIPRSGMAHIRADYREHFRTMTRAHHLPALRRYPCAK